MVNDGKTRQKGKIRVYSEINSKIALMFIFLIYLEEEEKKYNLIVPSKCFFFFLVNCPPAVDEDNYSMCVLESCWHNRSLMKLAESMYLIM